MLNYHQFLARKAQDTNYEGFEPIWIPRQSFDFQESVASWHIRKGKSDGLLDCGMGKTLIELIWAENVVRYTNRPVLILTPLAVAAQFIREGPPFGIECRRTTGEVHAGINVTNYEKLHHFNPADFAGCVCDESSAIKAMNGKRRADVTEFLRTLPYRLLATATAAPNDYTELGTQAEALGVMGALDMMSRFFKNDDGNTIRLRRPGRFQMEEARAGKLPQWRFKGHAQEPFFRWVCSWARAGRRPSDLGPFSDERFVLPPLIEREHIVETRTLADGHLFPMSATNLQEEREERRRTIRERCEMAAELVAHTGKPFIIWCHLNDEGDLLEEMISDAVQIAGADADEAKEEKWEEFLTGRSRGLISKQKIGGWGINAQHCAHVVEFASHSYEAHYQGVRRCWRYGQTQPVVNDLIVTEGEKGVKENMRRKSAQADRMFTELVRHMHEAITIEAGWKFEQEVQLPSWL